jgi:hypothetical protein
MSSWFDGRGKRAGSSARHSKASYRLPSVILDDEALAKGAGRPSADHPPVNPRFWVVLGVLYVMIGE